MNLEILNLQRGNFPQQSSRMDLKLSSSKWLCIPNSNNNYKLKGLNILHLFVLCIGCKEFSLLC